MARLTARGTARRAIRARATTIEATMDTVGLHPDWTGACSGVM
jgi:hypothetical protein